MLRTVTLDPSDLARTAASVLEAWRAGLIVVVKASGAPPDVHSIYDALLPRIGTPHYLAEDARLGSREVQRTEALWMEVRYDPRFPQAYRHSPNAQPLHTDGAYIPTFPNATLMCCVASAKRGGETVFIAAEQLVDALQAERPDLLQSLRTVAMPHARSGDRRVHTVIRRERGQLLLNWNYYCVAPDCDASVLELRDRFAAFLRESPAVRAALVEVKLQPGDAVVWKDNRLLHGRNAFEAHEASERFLWKCAVDVGVFSAPQTAR